MLPTVALVWPIVAAVVTLWLHARCYVTVAVGFCEVKYRRLRLGRARFAPLAAGAHLILPVVQRRLRGARGAPGVVFPVWRATRAYVETGVVTGVMTGGFQADAEFSYFVTDAAAFVRDEFAPEKPPAVAARAVARVILRSAIDELVHDGDAECTAANLNAALRDACTARNAGANLRVEVNRLIWLGVVTDLHAFAKAII